MIPRLAFTALLAGLVAAPSLAAGQGVAERPAETSVTHDGVLAFTLLADENLVRVDDLLNRAEAARVPVCDQPRGGALDEDEVSYIVVCGGAGELQFINTASFAVTGSDGQRVTPDRSPDIGKKNEVVVLGMIHDSFRTSERYSLDLLSRTIRAIDPDFVLAEIPPNRLGAAIRSFAETGRVSERRTRVFPEYTEVLFPLTLEMDFRIVGVAAWNRYMNAYRAAARRRLREDPAMADAWAADAAASREFRAALSGRADDPFFIHTAAYDQITRRAFLPDIEFFNAALGPGGWKNINEAHYRLVARTLDRHRGAGKRFLITFGASHKYWMLGELGKRDDIVILDAVPFLRAAKGR